MNIDKRLDCYERYFMRGEEEGLLSDTNLQLKQDIIH